MLHDDAGEHKGCSLCGRHACNPYLHDYVKLDHANSRGQQGEYSFSPNQYDGLFRGTIRYAFAVQPKHETDQAKNVETKPFLCPSFKFEEIRNRLRRSELDANVNLVDS